MKEVAITLTKEQASAIDQLFDPAIKGRQVVDLKMTDIRLIDNDTVEISAVKESKPRK